MLQRLDFLMMSRDDRAHIVRALMERGHSNRTAMRAVHTTRGAIATIRRDYGIPSTRPGFEETKKKPLPLRKIASSEATQCGHTFNHRHRCVFEKTHGDYCRKHRTRKH